MLGTLLYVVGLSIFFGLLTSIATDGQARSVSYTEFKQLVRTGKVAGATINQDRIRGTLKEADRSFVAIRIEDVAHGIARSWMATKFARLCQRFG